MFFLSDLSGNRVVTENLMLEARGIPPLLLPSRSDVSRLLRFMRRKLGHGRVLTVGWVP